MQMTFGLNCYLCKEFESFFTTTHHHSQKPLVDGAVLEDKFTRKSTDSFAPVTLSTSLMAPLIIYVQHVLLKFAPQDY